MPPLKSDFDFGVAKHPVERLEGFDKLSHRASTHRQALCRQARSLSLSKGSHRLSHRASSVP